MESKEFLPECKDVFRQTDATRMLLEAAPIGIVVVNKVGQIVLVNRNAQQLFGYTEAELIEQPLSILIPEASQEIHLRHCANYMDAPRVRPMGSGLDLHARRKDGSVFPVEISLGFTESPQGLLVIAFIIDITRQRMAEQLRDTMVHTLVHDLRNPLGAIYAALGLLTESSSAILNDEHKTVIEIATHNVQKMLTLINNILDVNKAESSQLVLHPAPFQLHDLIADTLSGLAPMAQKKKLYLLDESLTPLPTAWGDTQLIGRVLQNLIDNAIKFTPEGGTVRILAAYAPAENKLRVSVSDTGPGIPPELQPRLFQKFVTGKTAGRGFGLGLAFCKLVVEAHGGTIEAQSSADQGTTISFTLPVAE